jgi:hypothetical protein
MSDSNQIPSTKGNGQPQLVVGSWSFHTVPSNWEPIEGHGLRRSAHEGFPSNAIATEDELQRDSTLQQYMESQLPIIRHFFSDPQFEFRGPVNMPGVEEAIMLKIRFQSADGRPASQRQMYVRQGRRIGVLTFTALESELHSVDPAFSDVIMGATFSPPQSSSGAQQR